MAEDDVEIVIDAELAGSAAAGLAAAAQQARDLADAMERAKAAGTGLGQGMPAQTPGETPFAGPAQRGGPLPPVAQAALEQQNMAKQDAQVAQSQQANQAVADQQTLEDQEAGDAPEKALGWRAQLHGMRMLSGGNAQFSQFLGGTMGLSGRFGAAGMIGGGLEMAGAGVKEYSQVMDVLGNSFTSTADKARSLAEGMPVIGNFVSAIYGAIDAFSGMTDRIRQGQYQFDMAAAGFTADASLRQKVGPIQVEQAQSAAAAAAAQNILPQYGEAPSYLNTQDYQNYTAQNALEDKRVTLERSAAATSAAKESNVNQQVNIQRQLNAAAEQEAAARPARDAAIAEMERQQAGGALTYTAAEQAENDRRRIMGMLPLPPAGSAPVLDKAQKAQVVLDLDAGTSNTAALNLEMQQKITEEKKLQADLDKNAADARALDIEGQKQKLAILEQQLNKARSQYESIGGMDDASRSNAILALKQANDLGIQSLTQEQKGLIGGIPGGSDKLKELQLNFASTDPQAMADTAALRGLLATSGSIDQTGSSKDLPTLLAEQAAAAAAIKAQTQANAVASTGDTSGTVKAFGDQLIAAIIAATQAVKKHTEDKAFEKGQGQKPA